HLGSGGWTVIEGHDHSFARLQRVDCVVSLLDIRLYSNAKRDGMHDAHANPYEEREKNPAAIEALQLFNHEPPPPKYDLSIPVRILIDMKTIPMAAPKLMARWAADIGICWI